MREAGERGQEGRGARDRHDPLGVRGLLGEHPPVLQVVLLHGPVRQQQGHAGEALPPVDHREHLVQAQAVLGGPALPHPRHHRSGVDQGSVHVEQEGVGGQRAGRHGAP